MELSILLRKKRDAYQEVFNIEKEAAQIVLKDLRKFIPSNADKNTNEGKEINKLLIQVGMRKVLSHILAMSNITDDTLLKISANENKNE